MKIKFLFFSLAIWFSYGTAWTQEQQTHVNTIYHSNVIYIDTGTNNPQINLYLKENMHISAIPLIFYNTDPGNYTVLTQNLSGVKYVKHNIHGIYINNKYEAGNANSMVFRKSNLRSTGVDMSLISEYKLSLNHNSNIKKVERSF